MIISGPTLKGSSQISGAFVHKDHILAVASTFQLLTNPPARAAYKGRAFANRLALHHKHETVPFAWFDKCKFPVNHVSFHPHETIIAICTGSYDGGYCFEGELIFWNWKQDRFWQPFEATPEVMWSAFSESGNDVEVLVRPWDEDWDNDEDENWNDAFNRLYPVSLPFSEITRRKRIELELDPDQRRPAPEVESDADTLEQRLRDWFGVSKLDHSGAIWDVAWLEAGRIGSVHNGCLLDVHDLETGKLSRFEGDGYGASILRSSPPILHVAGAATPENGYKPQPSRLYRFNGDELSIIGTYDGIYCFSSCADGRILGRLDRNRSLGAKTDIIIAADGKILASSNLGHYDCFNHYIGIDAAPDLFFLQGVPASSHEQKRLCMVQADGVVKKLWPVLSDSNSKDNHAMECCGCYVEDDVGAGIIIAGCRYQPLPSKPQGGFLYRKEISSGRELWHLAIEQSAASSIVEADGLLIVAFLDGTLWFLDARTGKKKRVARVTAHGIPAIIYAMDVLDNTLVIGTIDGTLATVSIRDILDQNEDVLELG